MPWIIDPYQILTQQFWAKSEKSVLLYIWRRSVGFKNPVNNPQSWKIPFLNVKGRVPQILSSLVSAISVSQPFHCQDNSPYCLSYNSCDVSSESLVLHLLIILKLIFFFILVTCLLDIVLILWGQIMSWSLMAGKGCCNSG